jgi:DNA polymerase-3 subunit delta'
VACGAAPRFFPAASLESGAALSALSGWSRELTRLATDADHPWIVDLGVESLVEQGRQALKTARSERRPAQALSLNSSR